MCFGGKSSCCGKDATPCCCKCGMPMKKESDFGTNADGSINKDCCIHCLKKGVCTIEKSSCGSCCGGKK